MTAGGGAIAGTMPQTLDSQGLFTPTGQSKTVGYVAWACGGEYGFYVGSYGFGDDQIMAARAVIANGQVVDTESDKGLLWALCRAGMGSFAVVVELRTKLYPGPKLYAGFLAFPLSEAATVLGNFENSRLEEGIPDEFSGDAILASPEMLQLPASTPCFAFLLVLGHYGLGCHARQDMAQESDGF